MNFSFGKIIKFEDVNGMDVYNTTVPFVIGKKVYIAGRVERRDVHWKDHNYVPQTKFFIRKDGVWVLAKNTPILPLEDPFRFFINNELIIGGIEVFGNPEEKKFKTSFFKGRDLNNLKKFSFGPDMMKDIRVFKMKDGKIGIFTRPQGGTYGKGRIGFTIINSLYDLNEENILKAKIIENNLKDNEWEGVNDAVALKDDQVGVLSHIAHVDDKGKKHYRAATFIFDSFTLQVEDFKIIATRDDFPKTEAKNHELEDVVFPSGFEKRKDGDFNLYTGLSDVAQGVKRTKNPYNKDFLI